MHIPFISRRDPRGGGGGGGHAGGGGRGGGSGGKGGSSSSSSAKAGVVPAGLAFGGRVCGGGTRSEIYGTRTYGSGYPATYGTATYGRGFPFYYWPVSWPPYYYYGSTNSEYGKPSNSSRPGGTMSYITITSSSTTVRFLADSTTTLQALDDIKRDCSSLVDASKSSSKPLAYKGEVRSEWPQPEQVIQYYRASSAVLTLDGYNNTAALTGNSSGISSQPDTQLPSGVNTALVNCVNSTIGENISLSDGAATLGPTSSGVMLVWVVLILGYWL